MATSSLQTIADIRAAMNEGLTAVEICRQYLERIAALDGPIHAFTHGAIEQALEHAELIDRRGAHDADLPLAEQRAQAALRARLEPIVEMMQIKGESECRNGMYGVVGEPDELCNFEKARDFGGQTFEDCEEEAGYGAQKAQGCTSRTDFVRYALLEGLREEDRIGVNPYPFGFIGSTDTHMATPGAVSEYDIPY